MEKQKLGTRCLDNKTWEDVSRSRILSQKVEIVLSESQLDQKEALKNDVFLKSFRKTWVGVVLLSKISQAWFLNPKNG